MARLLGEPLREPLRLSRGGVLAAGMAVVLLAGPAWMGSRAESPDREEQAAKAEQEGLVLRGRVVDEQGDPLPDVKVVLYSSVATRWRGQEGVTNDNGEYEFDPLATGITIISEEEPAELLSAVPAKRGTNEQKNDEQRQAHRHLGVVFEHDTHVPADGKSWRDITINLEEGRGAVETLDLKMVLGGRLSGVVRNAETGEPMPKLSLILHNGMENEREHTFYKYAEANEQGEFTSDALFPGRYVVEINDGDFEGDRAYPNIGLVEVKAGETTSVELTTADLPQLQDPFSITGTAWGDDGKSMVYGGVGVRLVGSEAKLRTRGGGIDGRPVFKLNFGPVERGR